MNAEVRERLAQRAASQTYTEEMLREAYGAEDGKDVEAVMQDAAAWYEANYRGVATYRMERSFGSVPVGELIVIPPLHVDEHVPTRGLDEVTHQIMEGKV